MQVQVSSTSKPMLYLGRTLSVLLALLLLMDAAIKILKVPNAVRETMRIGYPESTIAPIGFTLLLGLAFYVIPRTSILGAILLTGYLGGATATMVRMQDPWFFFPVTIGMRVWLGLYLRDDRLRTLIPLRNQT